jgi:dTMP kinase
VRRVVAPALASGRLVLSDRSYLSTVAYQGARGLDAAKILADSEAEFPRPDLVLLFSIPAQRGLDRVRARGGTSEPAFENLEFLERVEAIFESLEVEGLTRIDADRSEDEIAADVASAIDLVLAQRA